MIRNITLSDDMAECLVDHVMHISDNGSAEKMARIQVILPTRRACLSVKNAFLRRSLTHTFLLPQLIPLYELNALNPDVPPAMPPLKRTLLLSRLCAQKPNINTPEQALKVAMGLGDLLDEFYQFETDTSCLKDLVNNPNFAEHWNETITFLDIITQSWPRILQEQGMIDMADRRIRLIDSYIHDLSLKRESCVLVAGLDGGLPVVRRLLRTVDTLPNGCIFVQGVDFSLSDADVRHLPPHHYQADLQRILSALDQTRSDIKKVPCTDREYMIQTAFKPENRTEEWRQARLNKSALNQITRIDCDTAAEEALTIALLMRGVLETPDKTAVLVTPDRNLSRRVIVEMQRWGIQLDDSAGVPATKTEIGTFLRLINAVGLSGGKANDVLALLKHPLAADGKNPTEFRHAVHRSELNARHEKQKYNIDLKTNLEPFKELFTSTELIPFQTILQAHLSVAEALATSADKSGAARLWSDDAGQAVFELCSDLMAQSEFMDPIEAAFYPKMLDLFLEKITVRPTYGMHPRLDILGPIEARFHHADVCIIGGLNEGVFPPIPETGPWLNRPMRQVLGLPAPESKIGALAMDFAHCFCGQQVFLTRTRKDGGSETIPSRFLARLEATVQGSGLTFPIREADWARQLDTPQTMEKVVRPAPCPPVSARPQELAVTRIEMWMRNPYAIYAQYILRLSPLEPLEGRPAQQKHGIGVHEALKQFIHESPTNQNREHLMQLARQAFTTCGLTETEQIFYLPRFTGIADFIMEQQATETTLRQSWTEKKGQITLEVDGKPFTLSGTADRIDLMTDPTGHLCTRIIDYKTGTVPTGTEVLAGFAPQLPLEALILSLGGFSDVPVAPLASLSFWKLAAKKQDCKIVDVLKNKNAPEADTLLMAARDGLINLVRVFNRPDTPYEVCPVAGKEPTYNEYAYLSRAAEWQHGNGDET